MTSPRRQPIALGGILDDVLKRVDPEHQLHAYQIWTFWNDEVGPTIARRAQPTHLRNGVLFVTVATHSWMQELQFMKETIRERLNTRLGTELVRDIFFVAGTVASDVGASTERAEPTPPGRALVPLPAIGDPALADAFGRIVAARAKRIGRTAHGRAKLSR